MAIIISQLLRPIKQQDAMQYLGMSVRAAFTDGQSNRFVEAACSFLLGVTGRALTGPWCTDPDTRLERVLSRGTTGTF